MRMRALSALYSTALHRLHVQKFAMAEYVFSNPMAEIQPLHFPSSQDRNDRHHTANLAALPQERSGAGGDQLPETGPARRGVIRYDHTEEIALPPIRPRPRPLRDAVQRAGRLEADVRTQLLHADECLYHEKNSEAIQYLETGLLGCSRCV